MLGHRNSVAFFHEHLGAFRRVSAPGSIKFECTGIRAKQYKNRAGKHPCNPVRRRHSVLPLCGAIVNCNGDLNLHQAATPRSIRPIQADLAIERFQSLTKLTQYPRHGRIDSAQEMALRNAPFEVEEIEQLALIDRLPTHHDPPPSLKTSSTRNHHSPVITTALFTRPHPLAHPCLTL